MCNLMTLTDATQTTLPAAQWTPLGAGSPDESAETETDTAEIETLEAFDDAMLTEELPAQVATNVAPVDLDQLYRLHYRRVYGLCLRMTSNPSDAEDLAHDVFIQLFRKLGSFRGESAFTTWLYRITVNQVLMHFRKKSYRSETVTEDGEMPETVTPLAIRKAQSPMVDKIALLDAVGQLPRGYRTVFILHDLQGYEHEEIAGILGISSGTSKSQLHKARLRMQDLLTAKKETKGAKETKVKEQPAVAYHTLQIAA